mmetsp:Transcript_122395/g.193881  ORF Transcript_122395/g.193881 Transcript_122395/m.193881 type:complete len:507 (-) Transcript_122395:53-1573(-)
MGKKRNIGSVGASDGGPVRSSRWWCYYCDAEARDESALITHQLAKHFRCPFCDPRSAGGFCQGMAGLFSHVRRSHAKELTEVPNAIEGRKDTKVEVYGMTGIPDGFADAPDGENKSETTTPPPPAASSTGAPHTVPPRDFSQVGSGLIVTPPPAVPLGAGAAQLGAALRAAQAAQALQGPQLAGILQQAQAWQVGQALQTAQTLQALQALQPAHQLSSLLASTAFAPPPPAVPNLLGAAGAASLLPGLLPAGSQVPGLLPLVGMSAPSLDLSSLLAPSSLTAPTSLFAPSSALPTLPMTAPLAAPPPPDLASLFAPAAPSPVLASSLAPLPTLPPQVSAETSPGLSSLLNTLIASQTTGTATATASTMPAVAALAAATMPTTLVTAHSTEAAEANGATSVAFAAPATAPIASVGADSKPQPPLVQMLTLIPQVCGNWEDSEGGGLIVIKSGPNCTVILTHELHGQQTIKYDEFIKDGKFRYREREGVLEGGNRMTWDNGSVWTRED